MSKPTVSVSDDSVTRKQVAAFRKMIEDCREPGAGGSVFSPPTDGTIMRLFVWGDNIAEDWQRLMQPQREWNFTCEGCGKHSDVGNGWLHDPEDSIWLCPKCKP